MDKFIRNEGTDLKIEKIKEMELFTGYLMHELRTPLNGIVGFLDLLNYTELGEQQQVIVDGAKKASMSMVELLDKFTEISLAGAGGIKAENEDFDLIEMVNEVILLMNSTIKNDVKLYAVISENVPQRVNGDSNRIKEVINNLISNSIKFTSKGEIVLHVEVEKISLEHINLLFKVKDTGIGIEEENLDKIFELYVQANSNIKRKFGGSGMGLRISRAIANLMGGNLSVTSNYGQGSVFSLRLKLGLISET